MLLTKEANPDSDVKLVYLHENNSIWVFSCADPDYFEGVFPTCKLFDNQLQNCWFILVNLSPFTFSL